MQPAPFTEPIKLDGVDALFRQVITASLLQSSANHAKVGITVQAAREADTFNVSSTDKESLMRFKEGLQKWWAAHVAGVGAVQPPDAPFARMAFPNFEEPVVDVRGVVVLNNPVTSNLDQRCSIAVTKFWEYFTSGGGVPADWVHHLVFLDLVPLLDSGKRVNMSAEELKQKRNVKTAATKKVFTQYAVTRIKSYAEAAGATKQNPFRVLLCIGSSKWKRNATTALKTGLRKYPEISVFDGEVHPTAEKAEDKLPQAVRYFLGLEAPPKTINDYLEDDVNEENEEYEENDVDED